MTKPSRSSAADRRGCCWTEREDYALRKTWGLVPCEVIAEKLHRSPDAVRRRALAMTGRTRPRTLTPETAAEICRLGRAGERVPDIADRLGVSESCVWARLKRAGVEMPPRERRVTPCRPWSADEVERLKAMMRDSVPLPEMARALGRTRYAIKEKREWVHEHGGCWD